MARPQAKAAPKGLIRRIRARGFSELDGRSSAVRAIARWRASIVNSLGGEENLSAQELCLVEQACRNRFILDSIDCFLFEQRSLVNRKRKTAPPVLTTRMQVDGALTRTLSVLGLKRREKPVPTLQEYLESKEREEANAAPQDEPQETPADEETSEDLQPS
jgi:hypothetical protein